MDTPAPQPTQPLPWRQAWRSWLDATQAPAGPRWMRWLFNAGVALGTALAFTLANMVMSRHASQWLQPALWWAYFWRCLVISASVTVFIAVIFDQAIRLLGGPAALRRMPMHRRTLMFSSLSLLGVALGWPTGALLIGADLRAWFGGRWGINAVAGTVLLCLTITLVLHQLFAARARRLQAERQATEAQLKLLQGQLEPHFLFNTLAGVVATIEVDPPRARQMLQAFTDHLRQALDALRRDEGPLADELALARSYLQLMQQRMEDRLQLRFDIDPAAEGVGVPPLLLQPLIENAIHHGLEPAVAGGCVTVSAQVADGRLHLSVRDDGRGLDAPPRPGPRGAGMALANLRQRLATRYGADAALSVAPAHPGTLATLVLPIDTSTR